MVTDVQRQRIDTMVRMQRRHNAEVHPEWEAQGYPYYRAVWVECAELLDHFGWKWWKHQQADLDQVRLEIVDIWHFALSDLLRAGVAVETIAEELLAPGAKLDFPVAVEQIAASTLADQAVNLGHFRDLMASLPMSETELFELYVGKNVLNGFRQANGYKDGSYRKVWSGREDNDHLIELMAELSVSPETLETVLFDALAERYRTAS